MQKPRLLIAKHALSAARLCGDSSPVFGLARLGEGLIQGLSADDNAGALREIARLCAKRSAVGGGHVVTIPNRDVHLRMADDLPAPSAIEVVDVATELDSRRAVCFSGTPLRQKTVLMIGAGSLGSKTAQLLAEAGVGRTLLVDPDRFSAANLSRHACGINALGRIKVKALADLLEERGVHAESYAVDVLTLPTTSLDGLVRRADLVVATTDSREAQFVTNEACVRSGTSLIAAGAYERACGGEVIVVKPPLTACLACSVGFRVGMQLPVDLQERRQAYQVASEATMAAEPGLGADIAYLASVVAAYALALLDPSGSRALLASGAWSFTLIHGGSTPRAEYANLFTAPFEIVRAHVRRTAPCPVCGGSDVAAPESGDGPR